MLLYRDIKPQNLVMSQELEVLLLHFTMGKVDKKLKSTVQVSIPSSPFQLHSVPSLLECSAGKQ